METEKTVYCPTGSHFLHDVISEIELGKEENKRLVGRFFMVFVETVIEAMFVSFI